MIDSGVSDEVTAEIDGKKSRKNWEREADRLIAQ